MLSTMMFLNCIYIFVLYFKFRILTTYNTILKNFMKPTYINKVDLDHFNFHPENYLQLDKIYFGAECEILILKNNISNSEIKTFKLRSLDFYVELCRELKKRFKFNDSVLKFLCNLNPKIATAMPASIIPTYLIFQSMFQNVDAEQLSSE